MSWRSELALLVLFLVVYVGKVRLDRYAEERDRS